MRHKPEQRIKAVQKANKRTCETRPNRRTNARVSTLDQNTVRQLAGVDVDRVFEEKASGKDQNRPELEEMIKFVRDGDTVLVHSMDRLARNLDDLRSIVRRLTAKKVRVEFVKEQLSFTGDDNAMANLLLNVMGAFAKFERSLIRERQREGITLAKKRGIYRGRAPSLDTDRAAELREKAANGVSKAALARHFGISRETVYAYLRAAEA
jgi:DNA invertase Pin-like site-specific DNA recombinase